MTCFWAVLAAMFLGSSPLLGCQWDVQQITRRETKIACISDCNIFEYIQLIKRGMKVTDVM